MSIIFDALKRADAQRQKGQAPTLAATRTAPHARSKLRLWALACLFVILGLCAWWFSGGPTKPIDTFAASEVVKPGAAREIGEKTEESAIRNATPQADLSLTETPVAVPNPVIATDLSAAELGASGARRLSVPSLDTPLTGAAQFDRKPEQVVVAAQPVAAQPVAAQPVAASAKPIDPSMVKPAETPELAQAKPLEVAVPPPPVAAVPADVPAVVTPEPALPSIFELDYKIRHDLPKMAVSMYVYNTQPQFRFVIIAGKRYAEGEQIESKVSVTKIRADGIECEFQGTRFFYPRQSL